MTEEIIIDGVNVAGCIYYNAEKLANCGMFAQGDFKCEGQICLYKQRKRLEQENELLKEQLLIKSEQKQSFQSLLEDNAKLKDENKKLVNELVKHLYSGTIAKINAHKYVNVLQEINLIIDELKQQYDYMEDYSEIKEIEKKINEVLK